MIAHVVLTGITDSESLQNVQITVLKDETRENVPRMGHYGLAYHPPDGTEGIAVFLGGDPSRGVVIATENRQYRLKGLAKGEVALFTDEGDYFHFKRNRELHVRSNKFKFQGASRELIDELCKLVQAIIDARTSTATGPQPLLNPSDSFSTIKSRFEELKV